MSTYAWTDRDAALFATSVRRLVPMEDDDIRAALELCFVKELTRGQYLLRAGETATETGMVAHGLLREFFVMSDGVERTKAFVQTGDGTGSLADLLSATPSLANIVAEEPARLLLVRFSDYLGLVARSPAWALQYRRGLETMYVVKATREYELLGLNAEERYARFATRYAGIEARVAARHVASYLGITPVHLSRLRRRRRSASK